MVLIVPSARWKQERTGRIVSVPDRQISVQKFFQLVGHRVKPVLVRFGVFYRIVSNLVVTVSVLDFQQRSMKILFFSR